LYTTPSTEKDLPGGFDPTVISTVPEKFARMDFGADMVTASGLSVPDASPPQSVNSKLRAGVAVTLTVEPLSTKFAPAGTVLPPETGFELTVNWYCVTKVAVNVESPVIVTAWLAAPPSLQLSHA
jgi:hypothetical protein